MIKMIENPWYYGKNVIRGIDRWVRDKDGEIWVDLDGVCIQKYHIKRF